MGKRIDVDRSKCIAVGACEATAPHLFQVDDKGVLHVVKQQPGEADLDDARRAVQGCPVEALSLVDERPPVSGDDTGSTRPPERRVQHGRTQMTSGSYGRWTANRDPVAAAARTRT